ncbi:MAG: hypothetical protein GY934_02560 [Gammaproteobacteria bacterium]|nr:hypothetical protein [Gammaproteobacteria bacterium]
MRRTIALICQSVISITIFVVVLDAVAAVSNQEKFADFNDVEILAYEKPASDPNWTRLELRGFYKRRGREIRRRSTVQQNQARIALRNQIRTLEGLEDATLQRLEGYGPDAFIFRPNGPPGP